METLTSNEHMGTKLCPHELKEESHPKYGSKDLSPGMWVHEPKD